MKTDEKTTTLETRFPLSDRERALLAVVRRYPAGLPEPPRRDLAYAAGLPASTYSDMRVRLASLGLWPWEVKCHRPQDGRGRPAQDIRPDPVILAEVRAAKRSKGEAPRRRYG